jgi:hypothetical protein
MRFLWNLFTRFLFAVFVTVVLVAGPTGCDRQSRAGQEAEQAAERLGDELGNILNEAY